MILFPKRRSSRQKQSQAFVILPIREWYTQHQQVGVPRLQVDQQGASRLSPVAPERGSINLSANAKSAKSRVNPGPEGE